MESKIQAPASHGRTGSAVDVLELREKGLLASDLPLCVDLDGTLVATDMLWEGCLALLRTRPLDCLRMPGWLLKGKAYFKSQVMQGAELDVESLPYRNEVLELLRKERLAGRKIILATAADASVANAIAEHLGIFDEVISSDGELNCKGPAKAEAIRQRVGENFDYLGDSLVDVPVWQVAQSALIMSPSAKLLVRVQRDCPACTVVEGPRPRARNLLLCLRPHQWVKNILLAVPLVLGHQVGDLVRVGQLLMALIAFSLVASAVYVLNDLLDLPSDRRHPTKRHRQLASGQVAIPAGLMLFTAALTIGCAVAIALGWEFCGWIVTYMIATTAYSFHLKKKLVVDVVCLAGLYTIRVLAGGVAVAVDVSPWLLAFSSFFFVSLAFVKRYTELRRAADVSTQLAGRGYMPDDLEMVRSVGPISGYLSVLVLCLYINSPDVRVLYTRPEVLWFLCPVLLYWITRVWFLAHRMQIHDDPIVFALTDRISYLTGTLALIIVLIGAGVP